VKPSARLRHRLGRDDRGNVVIAFTTAVAFGLLAFVGLAYDGGQGIRTYNQAMDLASSAARAGAQAIDTGHLYATGATVVDADQASERVAAYLARAGHPGAGAVTVSGDEVTVTVTLSTTARILPLGTRHVSATASATATRGVENSPTGGS
jgi:Flp pilus assembly protein TadG